MMFMTGRRFFCAALAMLSACAQPQAPEASDGDAAAAAPAGAGVEITAWARARYGLDMFEPVEIFYGDFTGDGAPDAFAWVLFAMGGSGAGLDVPLFRNEDGRMIYMRSAGDVFGSEPRDVRFETGRITLTTTMPQPDDPHCCPTGSQDWTILID